MRFHSPMRYAGKLGVVALFPAHRGLNHAIEVSRPDRRSARGPAHRFPAGPRRGLGSPGPPPGGPAGREALDPEGESRREGSARAGRVDGRGLDLGRRAPAGLSRGAAPGIMWTSRSTRIGTTIASPATCPRRATSCRRSASSRRSSGIAAGRSQERRFALKFLIHLVEDLHMPLHVGDNHDRGGNDTQVRFFDQGTNMHRLWDGDMLGHACEDEDRWLDDLVAMDTPEARAKAMVGHGRGLGDREPARGPGSLQGPRDGPEDPAGDKARRIVPGGEPAGRPEAPLPGRGAAGDGARTRSSPTTPDVERTWTRHEPTV